MGERFSAFSFVDRITHRAPGRIEGRYTIPAHATRFPAALMAEAVGQLAAWSAMSSLDFRLRPVAGIAGQTRYYQLARPGQTLMIEADVEQCDGEAVAYSGRAAIDGRCALELVDCIGPMLPMEEFDAPDAVRADFDTLCGVGATPGRFGGVAAPQIEIGEHLAGRRLRATLQIPRRDEAPFFGDHFPRRPVYPGTLLLDALTGLAVQLASEAVPGNAARVLTTTLVTDVKIRAFTPPGARLELGAEVLGADVGGARLKLVAHSDGKSIASARVEVGSAGSA